MRLQSELAKMANVKLIEQLPNGNYAVRYGFREVGNMIKYVTSQYPQKPTFLQISNSFMRFLKSIGDDFDRDELLSSFRINDYSVIG